MDVFRDGQPVDGDHGAVLRDAAARLVQRAHRADGHVVGDGEQRRKICARIERAARGVIGVTDVIAPRAEHQPLLERQAAVGQCPGVALIAQLADGAVVRPRDKRRDAPVAAPVELHHRAVGLLLILDGDGGIHLVAERPVVVAVGAAHERHVQKRHLGGRVVRPSAEQNQPAQALFALHDGGALDLVVARADLLHDHGIAALGDALFDGADDVGIKRVRPAAHDKADGVGLRAHEVARTVVGYVVAALNNLANPPAVLVADVRAVVEHAGDGADADSAEPGNILDGHVVLRTPLSDRLRREPFR